MKGRPPPETIRSFDLAPSGWHNFVWTGPSATDPGTALDCIADDYAIAYRLESNESQGWSRYRNVSTLQMQMRLWHPTAPYTRGCSS